jgi:hypothetical protein
MFFGSSIWERRFGLNIHLDMGSLLGVTWLTRSFALVLLLVWGAATWHCALEQVPGLEFLRCCQHPGKAPHQDNDCTEDACATVETGFYQLEENPMLSPALSLLSTLAAQEWKIEACAYPVLESAPVSSVPPELARLWLFYCRAALPPRAPCLVT